MNFYIKLTTIDNLDFLGIGRKKTACRYSSHFEASAKSLTMCLSLFKGVVKRRL